LLLTVVIRLIGPAGAQNVSVTPVVALRDWIANETPHGAPSGGVFSPDGSLEVHLGPKAFEDGLYVKVVATGVDTLILRDVMGYKAFDDMVFSPDGSHIAFRACPPLGADCGSPLIYSIRIDGEDIKAIARTTYDAEARAEYRVSTPSYSPDGNQVLLDVEEIEDVGQVVDGMRSAPRWSHHVGVAPANGTKQVPEILANGKPYFWSSDGRSIYYAGKDGAFRLELYTKTSVPVGRQSYAYRVVGRLPNSDMAFVQKGDDQEITIIALDGALVSEEMLSLASRISNKDSVGRVLLGIDAGGRHQLAIRYGRGSSRRGALGEHVEIISAPQ
jgi:hypothetical protein